MLVVNGDRPKLLSLGVSSACSDSAGLAIRGDNDATSDSYLSIFFDGHCECSGANLPVSTRVGRGITGHCVICAVKLSGPFVVYGVTCCIGAIYNDLDAIASGLVDHSVIFVRASGN